MEEQDVDCKKFLFSSFPLSHPDLFPWFSPNAWCQASYLMFYIKEMIMRSTAGETAFPTHTPELGGVCAHLPRGNMAERPFIHLQ